MIGRLILTEDYIYINRKEAIIIAGTLVKNVPAYVIVSDILVEIVKYKRESRPYSYNEEKNNYENQ